MLRNYSIENIMNASSIRKNHAVASIACALYDYNVGTQNDATFTGKGEKPES